MLNTHKAEFILYELGVFSTVGYEININLSFYLYFDYKLNLDYMRTHWLYGIEDNIWYLIVALNIPRIMCYF